MRRAIRIAKRGIRDFDRALMGHVGFAISNAARSLVMAMTLARFTKVPQTGATTRYFQHVNRYSAVVCSRDRCRHARLGRLSEKEGNAVGPPGRCVVDDVSGVDGAETSRKPGPGGGGPSPGRMGLPQSALSGAGTAASFSSQFPQSSVGGLHAPGHFSARGSPIFRPATGWGGTSPI